MATGIARDSGYSTAPDGAEVESFAVSKRKELIVIDFFTQLVLEGRMFHIQNGTESAPVNTTAAIADTTVWVVLDTSAGTTTIPTYVDVWVNTFAAGTVNLEAMVEVDRLLNRHNTGGTAFVPENMRSDRPRVSTCTNCYVAAAGDITLDAKSAVPDSMEIARMTFCEATPGSSNEPSDFVMNIPKLYSVLDRPPVAVVDVGSIITHFGAASGDATGFGVMEWAELPTSAVV